MLPGAAQAGVCDTIRPDWQATFGAQSAAEETAYVLFSPVGLVVLALLAASLFFPRRWLAIAAVVPVLGFGSLLALGRRGDMSALAMTEGCVGSITPTLLILTVLSVITLIRAFRRPPLL